MICLEVLGLVSAIVAFGCSINERNTLGVGGWFCCILWVLNALVRSL